MRRRKRHPPAKKVSRGIWNINRGDRRRPPPVDSRRDRKGWESPARAPTDDKRGRRPSPSGRRFKPPASVTICLQPLWCRPAPSTFQNNDAVRGDGRASGSTSSSLLFLERQRSTATQHTWFGWNPGLNHQLKWQITVLCWNGIKFLLMIKLVFKHLLQVLFRNRYRNQTKIGFVSLYLMGDN